MQTKAHCHVPLHRWALAFIAIALTFAGTRVGAELFVFSYTSFGTATGLQSFDSPDKPIRGGDGRGTTSDAITDASASAAVLTLGRAQFTLRARAVGGSDFLRTAEAVAYDTRIVRPGSSVFSVGQQVFLRLTAELDGTLSSTQFGTAEARLRLDCVDASTGEGCFGVHPEGGGPPPFGNAAFKRLEESQLSGRGSRVARIASSFDVPVIVGQSLIIQVSLEVLASFGADADFSNSATLTVEPAPGFEGLEIGSRALADSQPPPDSAPPATRAEVSPAPNANGWHKTTVNVGLTATDNAGGSGVKAIEFRLSGAQGGAGLFGPAGGTVPITAEGITTARFSATDNAGNVEDPKEVQVKIDRTPPAIAGLPSNCRLWPPTRRLVRVASITATDGNGSGVGPPVITVTTRDPVSQRDDDDDDDDGDRRRRRPAFVVNGGVVSLRAEPKGRIYLLTAVATDTAGNSKTASATCAVRKPKERDDRDRRDREHGEARHDRDRGDD